MSEFSPFGKDLFGEVVRPNSQSLMAKRFIVSPFSTLSARDGQWQERKAAWMSIGIESEIGRDSNLLGFSDSTLEVRPNLNGSSVFDPVLCELIYSWFSPIGGQVIDPFAGGSVRGIVSSVMGRQYWGCDLRKEQIKANAVQSEKICSEPMPQWVSGDSRKMLEDAPMADLVFSCPPYGDLEQYSDDPRDLSSMDYPEFLKAYSEIIRLACWRLKLNRFACFVVGDFRSQQGFLRGFVGDTIKVFKSHGLELYNEAILLTSGGSAFMRIARIFGSSRKFCKVHQNVLVFCKGDWEKAIAACGEIGTADTNGCLVC